MTQFTEAFYKAYYATKKELEAVKEEWDRLTPCFAARSFSLQELHLETIHLYEQLVQLEKLWGVYCVSYTEAVSERDKAYAEDESLKELAFIVGETK